MWVYLPTSLYSAEQEDSTSERGSSEDSGPSPTASSTITPKLSCAQELGGGSLMMPQSGTTFRHSTGVHSLDSWISSLAGSRARTCLSLEREGGSKSERGLGCGTNTLESFAKFDPSESLWKTFQASLLEGLLESFSGTWPQWGLMRNGSCFQPPRLEPLTFVNESLFLPTPEASLGLIPAQSWASSERKLNGQSRPSGAKIGSSLKWDLGVIYLRHGFKKFRAVVNPHFCEWMMGWPQGWTKLRGR